jgi:UDP-N-acetylmuramoylalanine--D-glutamate ligase
MALKALILGGARSGFAAAKLACTKGYDVVLMDESEITQPSFIHERLTIIDKGFDESVLSMDFDVIIKNPGIPYTHPFVKACERKQLIYNEIEFAAFFAPQYTICAITGTNGKTTTTEALGHLFKELTPYGVSAGNNGLPLSQVVVDHPHDPMMVSCEIAAFQLLDTHTFKPKVATILNLTPDHLDVFESLDKYYQAKWRIINNLDAHDTFILNIDDENIMQSKPSSFKCKVLTLSLTKDADVMVMGNKILMNGRVIFSRDDVRLVGDHNLFNIMVAVTMAIEVGIEPMRISKALRSFQGVAHRIEYVGSVNGAKIYNDSKATNVEATMIALAAFKQPIHLIAGGYDKHLPFDPLLQHAHQIQSLVVFGQTKHLLKALFPNAIVVETMKEALMVSLENAKKGEIVCLSPACASYDQFKNFEDRGDQFKAMVRSLSDLE